MRSKILALAMSVVLAFSTVSATALTAFADQLGAASLSAQAADRVVYDYVYGVFGGQYALMYKNITYSSVYDDGSIGLRKGTITDVVKADGTVTVHTSPAELQSDENPGGWTDYDLSYVSYEPQDITEGYIGVKSKSSGKRGVKKADGSDLVSCSFDEIYRNGSAGFVGITFGASSTQASFFGLDGSNQGVITISDGTPSSMSDYRYASVSGYGDYVKVSGQSTSYSFSIIAEKSGSNYVRSSTVTNIISGKGNESLVVKNDGGVYYHVSGRSDNIKIPMTNVRGGQIHSHYLSVWNGDGTKYYSKTGTELSEDKLVHDSDVFYTEPELTLADGTKIKTANYSNATVTVTDTSGNPITRNGCTLAIDRSGTLSYWNSVKHGNMDAWWATNSNGKWGAIDSYGNVKVPFEYDGYFDAGQTNTNYALVKKDGLWSFVDVSTGKIIGSAGAPKKSIEAAAFSGLAAQTYTGFAIAPNPILTVNGTVLTRAVDYTLNYANNVNAGTATVTATGIGDYEGQASATFTINKAANPMKVKAKAKTKKLKAKKLAKKKLSFASVKFTKKAVGKVTYKSASAKKVAKKFTVNKKTGKVTAKKGTKAGTYKVKVKVTAKGDANRKSASKTVTITVKVK